MKAIGIITVALLTAGIVGSLSACKKNQGQSAMTVEMTDAPAAWAEVNVEVQSVQVHLADSSWMTLNTNPGIYNLLDLQDSVTAVIADSTGLPAGHITQLRLVLGTDNTLKDTVGVVYPLVIPSGQQTGIKLNLDTTLEPNKLTIVVIDFDAEMSVVDMGNGLFHLKPVIKVQSITQI
jgi:hypothetical protein